MGVSRKTITGRSVFGIALGGGQAAADGLYRDNQVDEVFDRRLVLLEPHCMGQRETEPQGELGLCQPTIEVMPAQPARDRLR